MGFNISGIAINKNYQNNLAELQKQLDWNLEFVEEISFEEACKNWKDEGICDIYFSERGTLIFINIDLSIRMGPWSLNDSNSLTFIVSETDMSSKLFYYEGQNMIRKLTYFYGLKSVDEGEKFEIEHSTDDISKIVLNQIGVVLTKQYWDIGFKEKAFRYKFKLPASQNPASNEVKIGNQVWMTKNLNVETFRNGDPIPLASSAQEWLNAGKNQQPAWSYFKDDKKLGGDCGKFYNWYALNDPRGLAPEGWHVPSSEEWTKLANFLGGVRVAGAKMKTTNGWFQKHNGTNESGFFGLPWGMRDCDNGKFSVFPTQLVAWWAQCTGEHVGYATIFYRYDHLNISPNVSIANAKAFGCNVRCVKD